MRDTIKALHTVSEAEVVRNVVHYVYISTDSVYMSTLRPFRSLAVGSGMRAGGVREAVEGEEAVIERLVETDAVAPETKEQASHPHLNLVILP